MIQVPKVDEVRAEEGSFLKMLMRIFGQIILTEPSFNSSGGQRQLRIKETSSIHTNFYLRLKTPLAKKHAVSLLIG